MNVSGFIGILLLLPIILLGIVFCSKDELEIFFVSLTGVSFFVSFLIGLILIFPG